jgi:transcriptional regulator GlxA family with amidase domain
MKYGRQQEKIRNNTFTIRIDLIRQRKTDTSLSIGEIAFELGFEHSQSFSKLFKSKTAVSPLAFEILLISVR